MDQSKYLKTLILCIAQMASGVGWSMISPMVQELRDQLGATMEQMGLVLSANSLTYLIMAMVFSVLMDRYIGHCELFIFLGLSVRAVALCLTPYSTQLWMFALCHMTDGAGDALVGIACTMSMLQIWQEKSDSPLVAMSLCAAIGGTLSPFMIRPFLGDGPHASGNSTTTTADMYVDDAIPFDETSNIKIPWAIAAIICEAAAVLALVSYISGGNSETSVKQRKPPSLKDILALPRLTGESTKYVVIMCLSLFLTYVFLAGSSTVMLVWIYSYAIESDLPFTPKEAATLDGVCKGSYMIGRFVDVILLKVISPAPFIVTSIWLASGMALGLVLLGPSTKTFLFAFVGAYKFTMAPMWPGVVPFLDKYILVTSVVFVFSNVGAGTSDMFFKWFIGWLFSNKQPESVLYVIFINSCLAAITVSIIQVVGIKHGNRFDIKENDTKNVVKCDKENSNDNEDILSTFL